MCERGFGVADQHGGWHGLPPRTEKPGPLSTPLHPRHATPYGTERTGALGGETPLHAPRGARSGGTSPTHTVCLHTGREGVELDLFIIPSGNRQLEGTSGADGRSAHTPGKDFLSGTYPPGILRRLWHQGGGSMSESVHIEDHLCVVAPLAARHHHGNNLRKES